MRKAKEILKDRKNIEEKLTQSEIEFNKINYKRAQEKSIIKGLEKERESTTKEGIFIFENKLKKTKLSLQKHISKLKNIKKKIYEDKEKKKSYIFNEKQKIKKRKKQIKNLTSKIKKYSKISILDLEKQINFHKEKIERLTPELNKRKDIVNENKKQYKMLWKEWTTLHPEIISENVITIKDLNIFYGKKQAIYNVSMKIPKKQVISIIGPSGCGKSTLLKTINRINDQILNFKAEGRILLDNEMDILELKNIYDESDTITLPQLRTKVGMVFQQPNPFPMSIYNNVAYGPRINGIKNKSIIKEIVSESLKKAAIYDEVKDNLGLVATGLSGGQQQRLCIARAIANEPSILLMDEPTSALDPIAAKKVEDLILELKKDYTIILVTHSMQQAQRISDYTAFMYQGELIEYGPTKQIFKKPKEKKTEEYLSGKFG